MVGMGKEHPVVVGASGSLNSFQPSLRTAAQDCRVKYRIIAGEYQYIEYSKPSCLCLQSSGNCRQVGAITV